MTKGTLKTVILKLRNGTATSLEKDALLLFLCDYVVKNFIRAGIDDLDELT